VVWSVRVCDISEQNLVPSISMLTLISKEYTQSNITRIRVTSQGYTLRVTSQGYTLRVTSQASYSPEYITPTQKKSWLLLDNIDIEGTRFCSEISHTRTDQTA
jgi:hypothetical protein